MRSSDRFLGIIQAGEFQILWPAQAAGASVRLTNIPMQAAQPPESAELDLNQYEVRALMVRGHDGGGWIYSAAVIDQAGPILTAVVQKVFGQPSEGS